MKRGRGRPKGEVKGAREAIAKVEAHLAAHGLTRSALAAQLGMNPSSVNRALGQSEPGWTPSLKRIYRDAITLDGTGTTSESSDQRIASKLSGLLAAPKPATAPILAILDDIQDLVRALAPQRGQTRSGRKG